MKLFSERLALSIFCVFLGQISNSYISEVEKWRNLESDDVVYLFYDIHRLPQSIADEDKGVHYTHREQLIHFAKSTNSSLIVEDSSTVTDEKFSFSQLHKKFNGNRTAIHSISSLAFHAGVLSNGIEFRPDTVKIQSIVTITEAVEASEKQLKEIRDYQDGEVLNRYYEKNCDLYEYMLSKCEKLFSLIARKNKGISLQAYRDINCPEDALEVLRKYYSDGYFEHFEHCEKIDLIVTCYNAHLLDAAILHSLAEHLRKGRKSTIMYAGGGHLRRITPILTKMGYRLHEHYVEPYGSKRLFDIKRALQTIEPSCDPNKPLPKTAVDYFLAYKRWEADHSTLKKFVPAYTMAVWYDYYQAWKQEKSVVKKAVPVAIAGTALAVICALVKLYCSHK